jgi:hypothetical protein
VSEASFARIQHRWSIAAAALREIRRLNGLDYPTSYLLAGKIELLLENMARGNLRSVAVQLMDVFKSKVECRGDAGARAFFEACESLRPAISSELLQQAGRLLAESPEAGILSGCLAIELLNGAGRAQVEAAVRFCRRLSVLAADELDRAIHARGDFCDRVPASALTAVLSSKSIESSVRRVAARIAVEKASTSGDEGVAVLSLARSSKHPLVAQEALLRAAELGATRASAPSDRQLLDAYRGRKADSPGGAVSRRLIEGVARHFFEGSMGGRWIARWRREAVTNWFHSEAAGIYSRLENRDRYSALTSVAALGELVESNFRANEW